MDSIYRIFKFQAHGLKKRLLIFWSIMLIINILAYIITMRFSPRVRVGLFSNNDNSISIVGMNLMPIIIFLIVYGIVSYYEDFSLALSFGATRKEFYKSTIASNCLLVLIFSVIQGLLQIIDKYILAHLGFYPLTEYHIFNTSTDNILYIIYSLAIFLLIIISITNLLGVLQYRFGYKFWLALAIISFIGQIFFGNLIVKIIQGFKYIYSYLLPGFKGANIFVTGGFTSIISYAIGYFLIRKASIKK